LVEGILDGSIKYGDLAGGLKQGISCFIIWQYPTITRIRQRLRWII